MAAENRKPNFFVVGAAKCGTTSMYNYLLQHPDIFMTSHKETYYFGKDIDIKGRVRNLEKYMSLFSEARDEKWVGEATPWYVTSATAATEIKQFSPDAAILITIRSPQSYINSLHLQMVNAADEDILDLREALRAEPDRAAGKRICKGCSFPFSIQYRRAARFSEQIERYFDVFGRDRVMVVLLDEIRTDPIKATQKVYEFLEIDAGFQPQIEVHNPSRDLSSLDLRLKRFASQNPWFRKLVRRSPKSLLAGYRKITSNWFKPIREKSVASDIQDELREEFIPEIEALERLLDRDLSAWKS